MRCGLEVAAIRSEPDPETLAGLDRRSVSLARSLLGARYEWGGLTAGGIDCSGLVHLAFRLAGLAVPRDAWQQEEAGEPVSAGEERLGDVVTYGGDGARVDHVAFWLGDGLILHATARDGLGVVEEREPEELRRRRRLKTAPHHQNHAVLRRR